MFWEPYQKITAKFSVVKFSSIFSFFVFLSLIRLLPFCILLCGTWVRAQLYYLTCGEPVCHPPVVRKIVLCYAMVLAPLSEPTRTCLRFLLDSLMLALCCVHPVCSGQSRTASLLERWSQDAASTFVSPVQHLSSWCLVDHR